MFAYCGNNPIIHSDPSGNEYKLVGGGVQFELDCGELTVGVEIIVYWDIDECSDSGPIIAVYYYGGISATVYDPFIAAMIATIMDNIDIYANGSEAGIAVMAAILTQEFSIGVSGVAIWGDESFTTTEDYEGEFTSVGASSGKVRGGFAYSSNCLAVSAGGNAVGFQWIPSLNVSNTKYKQLCKFKLSDALNAITIVLPLYCHCTADKMHNAVLWRYSVKITEILTKMYISVILKLRI